MEAAKAYANGVVRMARVMAAQGNPWGDVTVWEIGEHVGAVAKHYRHLKEVPRSEWMEKEKDDDREGQGAGSPRPWAR